MPHRLRFAAAAVLLVAGLAAIPVAWAQLDAGSDRRRAVGDWLVESVAGDGSGNRIVRLVHEEGDIRIEYHIGIAHRAGVAYRGGSVVNFNRSCGDEDGAPASSSEPAVATVRARLAAYFDHCGVPAAAAAASMGNFDSAYALAVSWAPDAAAMAAAEVDTIDNGSADDMSMDTNMTMDTTMDADTSMDTNMTMDNETAAAVANATQAADEAANAAANPPKAP